MKKNIFILVLIVLIFGLTTSTSATTYTVTFSAGGTGYTSKQDLTATHKKYYVQLNCVSFVGLGINAFPYNKTLDARARTAYTYQKAGDLASFNAINQSSLYNYSDGHGGIGNSYVLACNSAASMGCTCGIDWTA